MGVELQVGVGWRLGLRGVSGLRMETRDGMVVLFEVMVGTEAEGW